MANEENLINWKPGQSGNPKGRPKKVLTQFRQLGYSKSEVRDTYAAIGGLIEDEVNELINDDGATILEKAVAKAFLKAKAKGDYKNIQAIIELFADKARQSSYMEIVDKTVEYNKDEAKRLMGKTTTGDDIEERL